MSWQMVKVLALTVSLTAFAFEGAHQYRKQEYIKRTQVWRPSFCDVWGGTWLGYFCDDQKPAGGGESGAS